MIRVILADDHDVVRRGIKQILSEDPSIQVVGEAKSGAEIIELLSNNNCDVLLMDISMPGMSGLDVLSELRKTNKTLPVIFLSMHPEEHYAVRAMKNGAAGYITKDSPPESLLKAVKKVASGGRYITSSLAERLADALTSPDDRPLHDALSERESQILRLMGAGKSPSEIAESLCLSIKTVSTYKTRVMQKMGLKSSAELIRYAVENKLD